jgi:RNA polymerase sigma-70 factor (ECF subfamily)
MSAYRENTDLELLVLLKTDDQAAFAELFNRYNRLLFIHACKLLDDQEEARDLVQEVFILIWDNRQVLKIAANFRGFLYATTRNRIFDKLSHKKVQYKYLESIKDLVQTGEDNTDHLARTRELQAIIEREISFLPPKMQEIFEMSRMQHLTHREIAQQLDVSEKTVKNQVNNALKILKTKLGRRVFMSFFA